tara:strand:- start:289 stop:456 length:168 start_codon:yes stop_codon:yes gene_type:complete
MDIKERIEQVKSEQMFKTYHGIKLYLDKVCKEISGGDLDLEEFMELYKLLKKEVQ